MQTKYYTNILPVYFLVNSETVELYMQSGSDIGTHVIHCISCRVCIFVYLVIYFQSHQQTRNNFKIKTQCEILFSIYLFYETSLSYRTDQQIIICICN